jgi:hypothetical protein
VKHDPKRFCWYCLPDQRRSSAAAQRLILTDPADCPHAFPLVGAPWSKPWLARRQLAGAS